jgi:DNA-binding NtrC family response regulator
VYLRRLDNPRAAGVLHQAWSVICFDRFLVTRKGTIDLATGATVTLRRSTDGRPELFARRGAFTIIDIVPTRRGLVEVCDAVPLGGRWRRCARALGDVSEALAVAEYGVPRAVDLEPARGASLRDLVRLIARAARAAGWIPVSLACLTTMTREGWPSWLLTRSLVVFLDRPLRFDRQRALLRLAARTARPHLLVRSSASARPQVGRATDRPAVREAVAHYGETEALGRFESVPGDVETRARWRVLLAEGASVIADLDRAHLELAEVLASRGRAFEARALLARIAGRAGSIRDRAARLRRRLDVFAQTEAAATLERVTGLTFEERRWAVVDDFVGVLELCQDTDDEYIALARVGAFLRERLQAATVAFIVREGPQLRILARAGVDPPQVDAARRSIESGCAVPAGADRGPAESASPVRHAAEVIGALWCRWSAGTPIATRDAGMLLGVAAAASAPSLRLLVDRQRPAAPAAAAVPELVGESSAIRTVRAAIVRAAASPFPVLIEGESGSGKELVARAIHTCSSRRERRFCAINCAALVDDLVEAELFGHVRGAFTGATADRVGLFEEAGGGTVFLDEVAELGSRVQAKLLRTLQEGEVRRLGESQVRRVDTRMVAATNRPLADEVAAGRFRRDLWYRLDVIRIGVPPLRARLEDLPALVRHLWAQLIQRTGSRASLSSATVSALGAHDWPGNVRELQNVLASILVSAPNRGLVGPSLLPAHLARVAALAPAPTLHVARRQFEERFVRAALARADGRTSVAARELGLSRQGLAKLIERLGIAPADGGAPPTS